MFRVCVLHKARTVSQWLKALASASDASRPGRKPHCGVCAMYCSAYGRIFCRNARNKALPTGCDKPIGRRSAGPLHTLPGLTSMTSQASLKGCGMYGTLPCHHACRKSAMMGARYGAACLYIAFTARCLGPAFRAGIACNPSRISWLSRIGHP